ncbi:hypothetical protein AAC387_Pa11g2030 [Persea americana]
MIQMMNSISSKIFSIKPSTVSILLVVTSLLLALIAFSPPTPFSLKSLPPNSLSYFSRLKPDIWSATRTVEWRPCKWWNSDSLTDSCIGFC